MPLAISIIALAALNAELDKSKQYTLTSFFAFLLTGSSKNDSPYFRAIVVSLYLAAIAWYCIQSSKEKCGSVKRMHPYQSASSKVIPLGITGMSLSASLIVWEDLIWGVSYAPTVSTVTLMAYNSLGALLCFYAVCLFSKSNGVRLVLGACLTLAHHGSVLLAPEIKENRIWMHGLQASHRVVQLSDLHIGPTCRLACCASMVEAATRLKPDLFVITGDVVDGPLSAYRSSTEPLRKLASYAPVIMVTGNHDHMHGDLNEVLDLMLSMGIAPLRNEGIRVNGLEIFGVDDEFPNVTGSQEASLVLVHRPNIATEIVADASQKSRLILAGHTHCGQMLPVMPLVWLANNPYFCGCVWLSAIRGGL